MIELNSVSFHQFKNNNQEELVISYGADSQPTANSELLVSNIYNTFANKNKTYANFLEFSHFHEKLKEYRAGDLSFYDFSKLSASNLLQQFIKYPFAGEGTFVMSHLKHLAGDLLLIGLVSIKSGVTVDDDITPEMTSYIDIDKVDLAAVINLSELEHNPDSNCCLSFIKGRVGRRVADFFMDSFEAEPGLNIKQQNQVLLQAVSDFCSDSDLERSDVNEIKKQVSDYCIDQIKSGDDIQIKELSSEMPSNASGFSFHEYTQENGYELEDNFPGDRPVVNKLTKFVGAGGGLNISFDSLLLGERVFYDPETDTLTIKGTPPNLKDQLARNS